MSSSSQEPYAGPQQPESINVAQAEVLSASPKATSQPSRSRLNSADSLPPLELPSNQVGQGLEPGEVNEAVADFQKALLHGQQPAFSRSASVPAQIASRSDVTHTSYGSLAVPGGFRRNYLHRSAEESGIPQTELPLVWTVSLMDRLKPLMRVPYLEAVMGVRIDPETGEEVCTKSDGGVGSVTVVFAILKSFVVSGVTYLPGAFNQGGWFFSFWCIMALGVLNAIGIRLLLDCRETSGLTTFSSIAYGATGWIGKTAVEISLVLSSLGTCAAYPIFIGKMAESLGINAPEAVVAGMLVFIIPLCFIRHMSKLELPNLLADALITAGLVIAIVYFCQSFVLQGGFFTQLAHLPLYKSDTVGVYLGTTIFIFEGIPTVLPIRESMKEPQNFWPLFKTVFSCIVLFYAVFGLLGYVAAGDEVHPVVLQDLPDLAPAQFARGAYIIAVIFSYPLMFWPAARTVEHWVFGEAKNTTHLQEKNWLIAVQVLLSALPGLYGGKAFQKFLAINGAICCAPVAFIYPALFHYVLCARTAREKVIDVGIMSFGVVAMGVALRDSLWK